MQVSIEATSPVERRMTVGVPRERIEPEIQKRLKKLARTVKINGFRAGKIPLRVVEQKFGGQIRHEVITEVLQSSFQEAVQQENLYPLGEPKFDINTDIRNLEQGLSYTAIFKVYPEIEPLKIEELTVEQPVVEVTEADIDLMLEKLRQQAQKWQPIETAAAEYDRITFRFQPNAEESSANTIESLTAIAGEAHPQYPGLGEQLIGVRVGEERTLVLNYAPEAAETQETIRGSMHIQSVERKTVPEVDATFAQSLGVADGNLETLRQDARTNMERELDYAIKGRVKQQLLEALLNANPIEAPQPLIEEEQQRLLNNNQHNLPESSRNLLTAEMFAQEANKRVKLGLLVGELIRAYQIQVQPERVKQLVERIASTYEEPQMVIDWYYAEPQRLSEIKSIALEDQVVEWLLDKSQIIEKKMDFYEIMEPAQSTSNPVTTP
ncbi:MAG: trigger factor [Pseudomonadota bacterium]|nr:trigger factor [Pseudomonadota bacterium]